MSVLQEINICIPTLNRYDKLSLLLDSLEKGSLMPNNVYILDNGGNLTVDRKYNFEVHVFKYGINLGVAGSWNWFIDNIPELRLICNDDLIFREHSLKTFVENSHPEIISSPEGMASNAYSCFIFPNKTLELIGRFDDSISPNYAYFEDNDYAYRLKLKGLSLYIVGNVDISHDHSSTLKAFSETQRSEHHRKFNKARDNYKRKWGGLPGHEKFITPYNK